MMNSNGDNTQPCLTPDVMSNQSVSPSDVHTVPTLFAYNPRMLSKSWHWTLHISRVCHSLSLFTLPNAFSWSTNTMFNSLSYSTTFSLRLLRRKLHLCSPLPFLKPICASLRNDCTLYLVGCSRALAYILPTWLSRELPPYISTVSFAALLLPYCHRDCSLPVVWDFSGIPCFVGDTGLAR